MAIGGIAACILVRQCSHTRRVQAVPSASPKSWRARVESVHGAKRAHTRGGIPAQTREGAPARGLGLKTSPDRGRVVQRVCGCLVCSRSHAHARRPASAQARTHVATVRHAVPLVLLLCAPCLAHYHYGMQVCRDVGSNRIAAGPKGTCACARTHIASATTKHCTATTAVRSTHAHCCTCFHHPPLVHACPPPLHSRAHTRTHIHTCTHARTHATNE